MPYFLPLQKRQILNKLSEDTAYRKKIDYINYQKRLTEKEIRCLNLVLKYPLNYKSKLIKDHPEMVLILHSYSKFADEKIKFTIPKIFAAFRFVLKVLVQGRYVIILRREKRKYWKFLVEKEQEIRRIMFVATGQLSFEFNHEDTIEYEKYLAPNPGEIMTVKGSTNFKLRDLLGGIKWIENLINNIKDKDKIILLNEARDDVRKILKCLEIDEKILSQFREKWKAFRKGAPETILLVVECQKRLYMEKSLGLIKGEITVKDVANKMKELNYFFARFLGSIEENLKLIESKRIVSSEKRKPRIREKRVVWIGSKEQLLELFFQLNENGYIAFYDEDIIIEHFRIVSIENHIVDKKRKYPNSKFVWLKSDTDFAILVNELVEKGFSPKGQKYKNFSEHFLNSNEEPFKYLSQKNYFGSNYNQSNNQIITIIQKITQL